MASRSCVATLLRTGVVCCFAVMADRRLACGADDGTVRLWDVSTRSCVSVLGGHAGAVRALAALPDGRLATACDGGSIRLWDARPTAAADGNQLVLQLGHLPCSILVNMLVPLPAAYAPSGCCVLYCGYYAITVRLLDAPPGLPLPQY